MERAETPQPCKHRAASMNFLLSILVTVALCMTGCTVTCPDGTRIAKGVDTGIVRARFGDPDAVAQGSDGQLRFTSPEDALPACRPWAVTEWCYLSSNARFHFEMGRLEAVYPLGDGNLRSLVERLVELRETRHPAPEVNP